ncbi:hypothetical protein HID58_095170 [Brassica napus]|uniref:Uncharacterized protein n=1 Tax=Brassica napus TaxID=3708 RepID=A0ABQ7X4K9_BRANA|nr:hypothetical protein HID58_095170 [Brassica napus]
MAKEEAMRQEAKRVEERMTLKHRNTGKWAKRMISRGLNVKYDGPKAAIAEQLQMNANLSRKMNSMRGMEVAVMRATRGRVERCAQCWSYVITFHGRAMKKENEEEANEEAKRALEEYEEWENSGGENSKKTVNVSGRRCLKFDDDVLLEIQHLRQHSMLPYGRLQKHRIQKGIKEDACTHAHRLKIKRFSFCKSQLNYTGWRDEKVEDSESEAEQMVDGVLTSTISKETFEVPSQAELINRAFAGDDVLDEFEKDKEEVLNQEVPKPEKPVLVPGWEIGRISKKREVVKKTGVIIKPVKFEEVNPKR